MDSVDWYICIDKTKISNNPQYREVRLNSTFCLFGFGPVMVKITPIVVKIALM